MTNYQVRDWLQRVLWQGNQLKWTDNSLPGQSGKFTYLLMRYVPIKIPEWFSTM